VVKIGTFVLWTIDQNFGGLENMSLIPGNVELPRTKYRAYGTEIKDTFISEALTTINHELKHSQKKIAISISESIFKNEVKDQYIITSVVFKLTKRYHKINTYGDITNELAKNNITNPSLKDVSNAVIAIRQSKLPDPKNWETVVAFLKSNTLKLISKKYISNFLK
jgi:UDP-N-acetylmuramate dehydrogenase